VLGHWIDNSGIASLIVADPLSSNNLKQVVYIDVPLSPSSIKNLVLNKIRAVKVLMFLIH